MAMAVAVAVAMAAEHDHGMAGKRRMAMFQHKLEVNVARFKTETHNP
jgi:hypothetical protein